MKECNFSYDIPEYGDIFTVASFIELCEMGMFTDWDGYGYPVKDNKMDAQRTIVPTTIHEVKYQATHIVWFNR